MSKIFWADNNGNCDTNIKPLPYPYFNELSEYFDGGCYVSAYKRDQMWTYYNLASTEIVNWHKKLLNEKAEILKENQNLKTYLNVFTNNSNEHIEQSRDHHFKWWYEVAPIRGF